jgi:hypothetical protein
MRNSENMDLVVRCVLPCGLGKWAMNRVDRRFVEMSEMKLLRNVPTEMKIFQSLNNSK